MRARNIRVYAQVICAIVLVALYTICVSIRAGSSAFGPSSYPALSSSRASQLLNDLKNRLHDVNSVHRNVSTNAEQLNLDYEWMHIDQYVEYLGNVLDKVFAVNRSSLIADSKPEFSAAISTLSQKSFLSMLALPPNARPCQLLASNEAIPQILTTAVRTLDDLPNKFPVWRNVLTTDWRINIFNDTTMDVFLGEELSVAGQAPAVLEEYRRVPKPVVKSDLFRYLTGYLLGGIYADSDTAPSQPVEVWMNGSGVEDLTPPTILAMNSLMDYLHEEQYRCNLEHESVHFAPVNEAPPQLIVALESDSDWVGGASCGLQLSQYAFASAPGHPVFLDVISQVVEASKEVHSLLQQGDFSWNNDQYVLNTWSGPVIWTEAVYRYLAARWGFDIRRLHHIKRPVRIGDVLILPKHSFRALDKYAADEQPDPPEEQRYIWHGSMGFARWRSGTQAEREQTQMLEAQYGKLDDVNTTSSVAEVDPLDIISGRVRLGSDGKVVASS